VGEYLKRIAQPFEARTFVSSTGDSLMYRLMKPLDFDSTRKYPLVVCLHGSSAVGSDNVKQVAATLPAQMLSSVENRKKYPAFLFVPQCPRGFGWGGLPDQPSVDSLVFEAIAAIEKEFLVDTSRRYVSGYSMGGYGAWHFICTRPEMFAAAVPICGGGDPELAKNIVDIPIWAFHGAKDMNVPVAGTRNIIESIKQAGGNPRYTEFPDAAHDIWAEVRQTKELPEWLFTQKRD
jgi:predicted peptidase